MEDAILKSGGGRLVMDKKSERKELGFPLLGYTVISQIILT